MFRSYPKVDRALDFFRLPKLCWTLARNPECTRNLPGIVRDLWTWFFSYRTFPDNYLTCRLWEVPRSEWKYYYGSNYQTYQRAALTRRVQPVRYAVLLDDKAVCERLCRLECINMPRTWGVVTPGQDYRSNLRSWVHKSETDALIVKPLTGAGGRGVLAVRRRGTHIAACSGHGETPLDQFRLEEDCVVQELVLQDPRLAALSSHSLNTVRVVTFLTAEGTVLVLAALVRCGVGSSYVDNWSAGGICIGVDIDDGMLRGQGLDRQGRRYRQHPTTGTGFQGFRIPEWARIVELATVVQRLFPWYRLLGSDIGLDSNGKPILIEVNDGPDLAGQEQNSGPLLRQDQALNAFGQEGLLINRFQRELYRALNNG